MKEKNQQNKLNKKFAKGFTLLELLVVVVIIGILAAIALPQYKMAVYKSRYKSLMALTNAIYQAEEVYYLANNNYTDNLTALDVDLPGCEMSSDKKSCAFDWGICVLSFSNNSGSTGDYVGCYRTEGLKNGYAYYFRLNNEPSSKKSRKCYAQKKDYTAEGGTVWEQVCEKAGATKTAPIASCSVLGACSSWTF